jgi:hypothetical protein
LSSLALVLFFCPTGLNRVVLLLLLLLRLLLLLLPGDVV